MVDKPAFKMGDHVEKISGSSWRGRVVGTYSTDLTYEGYAIESDTEKGSVQIYPAKALRLATPANGEQVERDDIVTRAPTEDARERVKVLEEALEPFARADVLEPNGVIVGLERYHFERARAALGNKETDRHG